MTTVVLTPPNEQLRIDQVWLFVSLDETGEGVCAAPILGAGSLVPLIAADEERMKALIPWAKKLAEMSGKQVKLVKFSQRSEVMAFQPDGSAMQ